MKFPKYGHYALDFSGNVMEVFATGSWNLHTVQSLSSDMQELVHRIGDTPWAALMDGRRWVLSTPDCQQALSEQIKFNIRHGLRRSAYVMENSMVKKAQLERTHPHQDDAAYEPDYQREYFTSYFDALKWLHEEGYSPLPSQPER
ncbi:hypothetical protein OCL06_01325 [Alteromonas sp. ASW11-19]|uniref:Uncharacterized protein n=1 Tax=Alteromonas salexigens TaxID=2982530 RepID=A0ABT2VJG0_9ALTE|nr:hypothetical protein [Alteromonas salexigens]MCU7553234.1 hypothetical protein [Alteromonas salexigens]